MSEGRAPAFGESLSNFDVRGDKAGMSAIPVDGKAPKSMIPNSGHWFSEKIMLKHPALGNAGNNLTPA